MPRRLVLAVAVVLLAVPGCGPTSSASFRLNMVEAMAVIDDGHKNEVSADQALTQDQQRQVATILQAMFGTPDEPYVRPETGLDLAKIRLAAGPVRSDLDGRKNGLYREHCAHCHGITGDGMGPTAAFLKPYPRDYRPGKFKFKSTLRNDKPTHADLVKILHDGIVGTSMPSFALLSPAQIDALAEYVKYLAMRGEVELALMRAFFPPGDDPVETLPQTREFLIDEILAAVATKWRTTVEIPVAPVPAGIDFTLGAEHPGNKESIAKGRKLFLGAAGCVQCHGPTALGDGQASDYDDWNKVVSVIGKRLGELSDRDANASERQWIATFEHVLDGDALTPRTIQPRNLRLGLYRGGRRPIDIYRRIYTGINGAPMPAVLFGANAVPSEEDIWHIVNYVLSLPYEFDGELGADRAMAAKDRF